MELRQMSTAFLFNGGKVLMMRKVQSRIHHEEFWTGLGGHLEPDELNSPKQACYREVYEEAGFEEQDIQDLQLKYILLRRKDDEIRQQFVYFGRTEKTAFINSDEGELSWVEQNDLERLRLSRIVQFMMRHYMQNPTLKHVTIGAITINDNQEPCIQWSELKDPLVF